MPKTNFTIKTGQAVIISKTLSGEDLIVSMQENGGRVHTAPFTKEQASKIDLGDKVRITIEKI